MYRFNQFSIILTAAALACWPATVRADHNVPYRDSVEGIGVLDPSGFPLVDVFIEGTGYGTHFGRFHGEGHHILDFTDGSVVGKGLFTTPDGSTIVVKYSGWFTLDPEFLLFLDIEFTNGTGRLAGVTGSADDTIVYVTPVTDPTLPYNVTFTYTSHGSLTFPDNRRR